MTKIYQQNQCDRLKEHFREHPYYELCKTVFNECQKLWPTIVMTPEQLFVDAVITMDSILQNGDKLAERCLSLWTEKYNQYRMQDQTAGDKDDTKAEVAILFYIVMYSLASVNHSHYCGTLLRILHKSIHELYGHDNCKTIEQKLHKPVNLHSDKMKVWMAEYFVSDHSLTKEIEEVLHPQKPKKPKKSSKEGDKTPYVLKYVCNDETTRTNRLQRTMMMMQNWRWIAEPKDADDFYDFFNGENRACNLKWIGDNTTVLAYLLKLLYKQTFFKKLTGASVSAILKNQFGLKSTNYNYERVSPEDKNRIALLLVVLNPEVTFKALPRRGRGDGFDYSDSVMNEVYKQELHIIKDLNKWYE